MVEFAQVKLHKVGPDDVRNITIFLSSATGQPDEAQMITRLRRDGDMAMELVYIPENEIEAYVGFTRLGAPPDWWLLTLICVAPKFRGKGYGREILRHGLDFARRNDAAAVTVMGDIDFFKLFGFSAKAAEGLNTSLGARQMLLYPIKPGTAGAKAMLVLPKAFGPD